MISINAKVCLLGDYAVGKTSLVRRFVYNMFEDKYLSTIGVKVSRKVVAVPRDDDVVELTMMLWDLAGSEEFNKIRASYLRGAAAALVVCDLTQRSTLDSLHEYARQMAEVNPRATLVIAANKCDLVEQRVVHEDEIAAIATELKAPCYLTSAKIGMAVEEAFRHLGRLTVS